MFFYVTGIVQASSKTSRSFLKMWVVSRYTDREMVHRIYLLYLRCLWSVRASWSLKRYVSSFLNHSSNVWCVFVFLLLCSTKSYINTSAMKKRRECCMTFSGICITFSGHTWKYIVRFWQAFSQWVSLNRVMWLLNCNNWAYWDSQNPIRFLV